MLCLSCVSCYAQWTKDITCPASTVYVDNRPYAGREEFCERRLPGRLSVKEGPFRSWFNEGLVSSQGNYRNGRQVGSWKECSRFGKCTHVNYSLVFPDEQKRTGFRAEIPVSYQHGRYIFDFESCWSTWVTQRNGEDLDLNINGSGYRCQISYLPRQATEHGGKGSYTCFVPISVGRREVYSLDLMHELPKLGLPQFCRFATFTADPLMIVDNQFRDVATSVDLQCAALERNTDGEEDLTFRLNKYASDLAYEASTNHGPLITRLCFGSESRNADQPTRMFRDSSGNTLFRYRLFTEAAKASQQEKCIAHAFDLKPSCQ